MPVNIIANNCQNCGQEVTVYVQADRTGTINVLEISSSCPACDAPRASLKGPETPQQRGDEALGSAGDESIDVVRAEEKDQSRNPGGGYDQVSRLQMENDLKGSRVG
ncbi:MAG: hypothetical protein KGL39_60195 [Patescibacteria group bacterium]|nr:hypothetical protein [Patescibacteria group bacterium]